MRSLLETVAKVADHELPVLIRGESGTGKNHLAGVIHASSRRQGSPFVQVDCASIPHDLFESELFGYEKGTFTDAASRRIGKLEAAGKGTVYLDEIAALAPPLQAKLLRVLEERRFSRLGGSSTVDFQARVIASTSTNLEELLRSGGFRRDLLYRIEGVTLTLPPLRERREDIPDLARAFLRGSGKVGLKGIDDEAMRMLCEYPWPGNLRELRNVMVRAALLESGERVSAQSLPEERFRDGSATLAVAQREQWTLEELESRHIREVLRSTGSNYSEAARILGINRKTLLEKRRKYGLDST